MKLLLTLFLFLLTCGAKAQHIGLLPIPSLPKLPVNAIHRIFQDSEGYMWYGTVNGLCRDDGYRVDVFRSDINSPGLLDNNLIESIAEDKQGNIWFGTNKGAYWLDKRDYSVRAVDGQRLKGQFIHRVDATSDGLMWISIAGSLLCYSSEQVLLHEYPVTNNGVKSHVAGFCENRAGQILVTYAQGFIYTLDRATDSFQPYPLFIDNPNFGMILQDREEEFYWIGTWNRGIVKFDPTASNQDSVYVYQPLPLNSIGNKNHCFLYLEQDGDLGYLWGTTSEELVAFQKGKDNQLEQVSLPQLLPSSNKMLNEIVRDRYGSLWVSAFDRPSFIIHFTNDSRTDYQMPALRKATHANPAIMAMVDSGDQIMWVSQERTGLCLYNLRSDECSLYSDSNLSLLPFGTIKIMAPSSLPQSVWVAPSSSKRVYRLGRNKMQMELLDVADLSAVIEIGAVQSILEAQSGKQLWVGTNSALYRYNIERNKIDSSYSDLGFITDMVEIPTGELCVVTSDKGFYRIDKEGVVTHIPILHHFSSVTFTTDNLLWLGSDEGGLYAFDLATHHFSDHSDACGLQGNMVNQVMSDVFNHLWIETNQRLIEFNPRNNSFSTYETTDDSMLLWRLIPTSMCEGKDGKIYVGGIPGISSFTPSNRLESAAKVVEPLITNVKSSGSSLVLGQTRAGCSLREIRLTPADRNVEITFSSLNHRFAHKIRYAYRLVGVDTNWTYTASGECWAFYNQIPAGEFLFEVKATDEHGLWSDQVTQLKLSRAPAFYETWWAYTFYVLLISALLVWAIWAYLGRMKRKNNELWNDSEEMLRMRHYLDSEVEMPESEFTSLDKALLDKATKCVEANLTEPDFDVTSLAAGVNMSRSTLTRKLKAITGKTPLEFIRNIKMQHAHYLLANKGTSIAEVATNLGYFNRKYFASCFKEEFGMTPSELQKRAKIDSNEG